MAERWESTDWRAVSERVAAMQAEISRASMAGGRDEVRYLSERFLSSPDARMLAVRNVTSPSSTVNPGVGEPWDGPADLMKGSLMLSHHGYVSDPFLTFTIHDEKTGRDRDICIPTYHDRAMHDLYRMLMEPIVEPMYDLRLYSSRIGRSLADAVAEVAHVFSGDGAPQWVARCDVKSFYDTMSHEWLLDNVPMERSVLEQFLRAPRVRGRRDGCTGTDAAEHVRGGVPTGNRLSPVMANLILNGLEAYLVDPDDPSDGLVVRWVDDIVVTARTEDDALRYTAKVRRFLAERGMALNEDKSYVRHVDDGFEFLRFDFFRRGDRVDYRPTLGSVESFMEGVGRAVRSYGGVEAMVGRVNDRIRGFVTKYRVSDLSTMSGYLDRCITDMLLEEAGRHTLLSDAEVRRRFVRPDGYGGDTFTAPSGRQVARIASYPRVPHERVWLTANPFLDRGYFDSRAERLREMKVVRHRDLWHSQGGRCAVCGLPMGYDQGRTVATDTDGRRGFVHTGCWEDTERSRTTGHFRHLTGPVTDGATSVAEAGPPDGPVAGHAVDTVPEQDAGPSGCTVTGEPDDRRGPVGSEDTGGVADPDVADGGSAETGSVVNGPTDTTPEVPGPSDPTPSDASAWEPARGHAVMLKTPSGRPSKFQPLADFLSSCPYSYYDVNLDVVQQVMGGGLCDCAMRDYRWWSKSGPGTINDALGQIGWSVASANIDKGVVRFQHCERRKRGTDAAETSFLSRRDPVDGARRTHERDERMRTRRYGRMTEYLLECGMDQVVLSFKRIGEIVGFRLPDGAWRDRRWWCNRREIYMLAAIEDGDFAKVRLDMEGHTVLLTRTCCVPDPFLGDVPEGGLPLKGNMMR